MREHRGHALRREGLVLAAYAAVTACATCPLAFRMRTAIPGSGDSYQFLWNLWWVKRALVERHANP